VLALRRRIGIPHTLKEIGVDTDIIPQAGKMAEHDPTNGGNPKPLTAKEYEALYAKAIAGSL
jgi:alcohol dehydrogenase class IV